MGFPDHRPRRLRANERLRSLVRETRLHPSQLVQPLFVCEGEKVLRPIVSMPGQAQRSVDLVVEECRELRDVGVGSVLLFGLPAHKDAVGSSAWDEDGVVPRAVRAIKQHVPEILIWCDVCLCEYTDHGHCGVLRAAQQRGASPTPSPTPSPTLSNEFPTIDNDATLPYLASMALTCARAGADIIAPSDMMDGRIGVMRRALDGAGFIETVLVSYAAKYASSFYGPFREAADNAPAFGDRRAYQMDLANSDEALREVALDLEEGADIVMIKPALAYLDVIHRVKTRFGVPVAAYNVSGEYAMVKAAAERGWIDEERVTREILLSIARAGADIVVTYHAKDVAAGMLST